jgi:hypothetical protein
MTSAEKTKKRPKSNQKPSPKVSLKTVASRVAFLVKKVVKL